MPLSRKEQHLSAQLWVREALSLVHQAAKVFDLFPPSKHSLDLHLEQCWLSILLEERPLLVCASAILAALETDFVLANMNALERCGSVALD